MRQLFSFDGRAARAEWWGTQLVLVIPLALLAETLMGDSHFATLTLVLQLAVLIPAGWISIATAVRRFHDRNKDGIWYLINFVPVVGPIWFLIECGFLRGTVGENRYGMRGRSLFDLPR
jgi:uncharacterized membrane protein YhaH (DUF805 family)